MKIWHLVFFINYIENFGFQVDTHRLNHQEILNSCRRVYSNTPSEFELLQRKPESIYFNNQKNIAEWLACCDLQGEREKPTQEQLLEKYQILNVIYHAVCVNIDSTRRVLNTKRARLVSFWQDMQLDDFFAGDI